MTSSNTSNTLGRLGPFEASIGMRNSFANIESLSELLTGVGALAGELIPLVVAVSVMLSLDAILVAKLSPLLIFVAAVIVTFRYYSSPIYQIIRATLSRLNEHLHENLSGIEIVQMSGREALSFKQYSAINDANRVAETKAIKALVYRLGITSGQIVIDLGAGTGTFAIQASLTGASIHPVDISQAMLTYARNKAQKAGATNIQFHRAGFLTYEHCDRLADLVVSKAALHILPDFWKMVAFLRIASMLKPSGRFFLRDAIFSFPPAEHEAAIQAWIEA